MKAGWILIAVVALSFVLTGLMRRYALYRQLLDHPNERSSHFAPTPRGGGVAIVMAFMASFILVEEASAAVATALMVGGAGVAAVGFVDDHGHIAARWRLLAHFFCAAWILYWIGIPRFEWMGAAVDIGPVAAVLAALYLVWMLNLYNFMDGIDGIAGVEALTVGAGGTAVYWLTGMPMGDAAGLPALLAAASLGFLLWNFPPARIFMGDAGSGFLGLMLGAFSLQAAMVRPVLFWCWLVLLGVFIVDATVTLIRRLLRGERVYEAHCSHAYQHASREFGAHRPVTLAVAALNLFWLLPWAMAIASGRVDGVVGLVVAYIPLVALALRFKAGTA
ncbi:MraY family glycosyltransferase [Sulfuritalea hydrogenivorans]|nr:glycosyltransferase family 4 protein [Sulfuritalea hydrogenivorans]